MYPSVNMLLEKLPPYEDHWVMITPEQSVKDIIIEVIEAHKEFAPYYDKIALYFDADNIDDISTGIYDFMKSNIRYKEESEDEQTTALPTGLLTRGYGDCKHYSGMAGGILDALNRLTGKKIDWNYRFASYDPIKQTPHHVFVVIKDDGKEIWIDPTPGANVLEPSWLIDKKVKAEPMALHRNISGVNTDHQLLMAAVNRDNAIGKSSLTLTPRTNANPLNWNYSNHYPGVFNPYLGLSQYRDEGGDRNLNSAAVAQQLNQLISTGPSPGHTVDPDFVTWVYETNLRSWNFYYPGGVAPGFTAASLLPADYPKLVITGDGRLTFDRDVKIDDYKNPEIHLLTAWAQSLINQHDPTPYPIKPQHLKEFSQLKYGNVDTRNLFTERRGSSIFQEIGKALEDGFNFVKRGWITIVGFAPRNAFLGLVGINAFNFAGNLWERIQAGQWDEIAKKWKGIGGNPEKLRNTIEDGKDKNAILGTTEAEAIGEVATGTASLLALAAPIIAVLLKFLDKDGKAGEVLSATKTFLQTAYPDLDLDAYGFLDRQTGEYLQFDTTPEFDENLGAQNNGTLQPVNSDPLKWAAKNPLPVAAGAGAITYFLTNKKGMKPNYIIPLLVTGGVFLVLKSMNTGASSNANSGTAQKKAALITLVNNGGDSAEGKQMWARMVNEEFTDQETADVYAYLITYGGNDASLPVDLKSRLMTISSKYNIFS